MTPQPATRDLVLIGGGHAHALVLRMLAMDPVADTRLTLVSPDSLSPYSGMLPGMVAGHYREQDTHIDLPRLCQWAGVRFIRQAVTGIHAHQNQLTLADGSRLDYDWLSVDIGSVPHLDAVPGAREHAVPVKPVASFRHRWQRILDQLDADTTPAITVVGAGAGGTEMALAIRHALDRRGQPAQVRLVSSTSLLPGYPTAAQRRMARALARQDVLLETNTPIESVTASHLHSGEKRLPFDLLLWCTGASDHVLPHGNDLDCNERGFIRVDQDLRSTSHRNVFAAGDCCDFTPGPLPKAGVYSVRQAPVLAYNLRAAITGTPTRPYRPQSGFLSLLSGGEKYAIGCRGPLVFSGAWVWRWKDRIDRRFMAQFEQLPTRTMRPAPAEDVQPRCAGCGAKVGSEPLQKALHHVTPIRHDDVLSGLDEREDASTIRWPAHELLVQNHDFFPAFIDEPDIFGRIAALHSLSDIYAVNATPHSALATVTLPVNHQVLQSRDLRRLMQGAVTELNRAGCALVGGHTLEGPQMAAGFTINGRAREEMLFHKSGARPGDALVLTKPLGTGIILAGLMHLSIRGPWLDDALECMLQSNAGAASVFARHGVRSCTDITGFGLLGHLLEMCRASHVGATLDQHQLPVLAGVPGLVRQGIESTLKAANDIALASCEIAPHWQQHPLLTVLTDPQTSGGLLAAVPADRRDACLDALGSAGITAWQVGTVTDRQTSTPLHLQ
ncbi:MAG: selenide, water dikinase SelD [Alcanivoracaceae bacterium]|nr:selenide, water dikinase SelD [Alcanivoracaceae bacterium]